MASSLALSLLQVAVVLLGKEERISCCHVMLLLGVVVSKSYCRGAERFNDLLNSTLQAGSRGSLPPASSAYLWILCYQASFRAPEPLDLSCLDGRAGGRFMGKQSRWRKEAVSEVLGPGSAVHTAQKQGPPQLQRSFVTTCLCEGTDP